MTDIEEKYRDTAPWDFPTIDCGPVLVTLTVEDISLIRRLIVFWESAENGAAALQDEDGLIQDDYDQLDDPHYGRKIEIFLNQAQLSAFEGVIENPYLCCPNIDPDLKFDLDAIPDKSIADVFRKQKQIAFTASKDELILWHAAVLTGGGIDPKRPFGREAVSKSVRVLIDPHKKLDNPDFAKHRRYLESRLMFLMQFFVQNALLPLGTYGYDDEYETWKILDQDEVEVQRSNLLSEREWVSRAETESTTKTYILRPAHLPSQKISVQARVKLPNSDGTI